MDSSTEKSSAPVQFRSGHALVVGVGADLPNTTDDAAIVAELLADPERCAYPDDQVHLLVSESANRAGILSGLDRLAAIADAEATVVVYFSGHGYQVQTPAGSAYYLMPHGYDTERLTESAISGEEFTEKLRAIPARRLLVLLDCCHAGGLQGAKSPGLTFTPKAIPEESLALLSEGRGRVFIASSRADELSYTGKPYSAFTLALAEALCGSGIANQDGLVRVTDLALYAREVVPLRTGSSQHPILHFEQADNFPVAYYAGGDVQAKGLPFEAPPPDEDIRSTTDRQNFELYTRVVLALEKRAYGRALSLLDKLEEVAPYYPRIDELRESAKKGIVRWRLRALLAAAIGGALLFALWWIARPPPAIACEGELAVAPPGRILALAAFSTATGAEGLWIGRAGERLELAIDGEPVELFYADELGAVTALSLALDRDEKGLWVGVSGGGLSYLTTTDGRTWTVERRVTAQQDGLPGCKGSALLATEKGIYAGFDDTRAGVLALSVDGESWAETPVVPNADGDLLFRVADLVQGRAAAVWVGAATGLFRFDGKGWAGPFLPEGVGRLDAQALAVDTDGLLWIGSEAGGLWTLTPDVTGDRWLSIPTPPGITDFNDLLFHPPTQTVFAATNLGLLHCSHGGCLPYPPKEPVAQPIYALSFSTDARSLWAAGDRSNLQSLPLVPSD